MSESDHHCAGAWILVPELSLYQAGQPPRSGRYEIELTAQQARFSVAWRGADDDEHAIEFGGCPDGARHRADSPGVTHLSIDVVDPYTLDSRAFRGQIQLAYARRRASDDGELLSVVQELSGPDGSTIRNFQVYRRAR